MGVRLDGRMGGEERTVEVELGVLECRDVAEYAGDGIEMETRGVCGMSPGVGIRYGGGDGGSTKL